MSWDKWLKQWSETSGCHSDLRQVADTVTCEKWNTLWPRQVDVTVSWEKWMTQWPKRSGRHNDLDKWLTQWLDTSGCHSELRQVEDTVSWGFHSHVDILSISEWSSVPVSKSVGCSWKQSFHIQEINICQGGNYHCRDIPTLILCSSALLLQCCTRLMEVDVVSYGCDVSILVNLDLFNLLSLFPNPLMYYLEVWAGGWRRSILHSPLTRWISEYWNYNRKDQASAVRHSTHRNRPEKSAKVIFQRNIKILREPNPVTESGWWLVMLQSFKTLTNI